HNKKAEFSEVLAQVTPEDVISYGMIPEMVGRLPIITTLSALDEEALVEILTKPKNALVRQYQKLFEMEEADLKFTDEALKLIAKKAIKRDTGARALRAVMEELMVDLMYQLPEEPKPGEYTITPDVIEGETDPFEQARNAQKESA
ncbi:MAG: ATP-dependent Clp protease ATP-binding subunit ClpX, partial [Planctomycetes bacterium]|nr:ATP-dependent Clp protease ATP-binding subunit ClpX [Planctomycetota bacterium]